MTPTDKFQEYLKDNIRGYHLLYNSAITEKEWNRIIYMTFRKIEMTCNIKIKTKTCTGKNILKISSYRLTNSCSTEKNIISEINKRYDDLFYFILVKNNNEYGIYIIPSNSDIFNPTKYKWEKTIGQRGKYSGKTNGWKTDKKNGCKMTITYGSTYQLWYYFDKSNISKYKLCSVNVTEHNTICYSDLLTFDCK